MHLLKVQHFVVPYRSIFHIDPFQQKCKHQMYTSSDVHSSSRYRGVEKWRRARCPLLAVGERKELRQDASWASSAMGMSTAEQPAPLPPPHTPTWPTATPFYSSPSSFLQLEQCWSQFNWIFCERTTIGVGVFLPNKFTVRSISLQTTWPFKRLPSCWLAFEWQF